MIIVDNKYKSIICHKLEIFCVRTAIQPTQFSKIVSFHFPNIFKIKFDVHYAINKGQNLNLMENVLLVLLTQNLMTYLTLLFSNSTLIMVF